MRSSPGVITKTFLIFYICKRSTICFKFIRAIIFADDANLFYAEEKIKTFFDTVNIEFEKLVSAFDPINYLST